MMDLKALLAPWVKVDANILIQRLVIDSRQVKQGDLFCAYKGHQQDSRLYIADALNAGASAVLYDPIDLPNIPITPVCFPFEHLARHLGDLAAQFYTHPTEQLRVIGITGTNGKTTIAYLLAQAYEKLGSASAYSGTLGMGPIGSIQTTANTTPDAMTLQGFFHTCLSQQIQTIAMEVSSHALVQERVQGIQFEQAIFTNLTHDHLDYHHTMQAYAEAKALLFAKPNLKHAIINLDDAFSPLMQAAVKSPTTILTYGLTNKANVYATNIRLDMRGTSFTVHSPWGTDSVSTALIGEFNVYNLLAVMTSLLANGYSFEKVCAVISVLRRSLGRMERVHQNPCVIVDYAHTPDALAHVLQTLQQLKQHKLWVIFGCGGDRDKTKRPLMGKIAETWADEVVVTSDNPRTENAEEILQHILAGIEKPVRTISDRKLAIETAISLADPNDLILIAGKGHEDYQQIGLVKEPFSDAEVVRQVLKKNHNDLSSLQ